MKGHQVTGIRVTGTCERQGRLECLLALSTLILPISRAEGDLCTVMKMAKRVSHYVFFDQHFLMLILKRKN